MGGPAADTLLTAGAAAVTIVAPAGLLLPVAAWPRIAVHERITPLAVRGDPQVERLECDGAEFDCDAVVLAHGLAPVRNVDGAVSDGLRTVYAQPLDDPPTAAGSQRAGAEAARAAVAITEAQATITPWSSSPSSRPSA